MSDLKRLAKVETKQNLSLSIVDLEWFNKFYKLFIIFIRFNDVNLLSY